MDKIDKNKERISKIKKERLVMLKNIKDEIRNNNKDLTKDIKGILKIFNFDNNNIKKIEELNKTKEIITELIMEIVNSKSLEEIQDLKRKLNYYINKIKNEMQRRNINYQTLFNYNKKVKLIRNNISQYVRILKRKQNIEKIVKLNNRYNKLSTEELQQLRKLLSLERKYNTNYFKEENRKNESKYETRDLIDSLEKAYLVDYDNKLFVRKEEKSDIDTDLKDNCEIKIKYIETKSLERNEHDIIDYIDERINIYDNQYNIEELEEYGNSKIENIVVFIRNIKKNIKNKKKIKLMNHDSNYYYSGKDFLGYIEYVKQRNSIKNELKSLFSKIGLFSKQLDYLTNHEQCINWIMNYCNYRDNCLEKDCKEMIFM